ncbi:hypothetical protein [uncultured Roseibium sp.]|uniref:hypothetical protein n=1 Tax=uncultured Roseibium sp. TaxID=1936171 RepID=UPI002628F250|nr:hypothetical protein [uncultured Roseibium sp.]
MKHHDPIFFVDYCGIREKDGFLTELAGAFSHDRNLVVLDSIRRQSDPKNFIQVAAPQPIFRSKRRPLLPLSAGFRRILSNPILRNAVEQLVGLRRERHSSYRQSAARKSIAEAFAFTKQQIDRYRPDLVVVWNQFHPLSKAAVAAAHNQKVKVAFAEFGLLPGTFNFDLYGQMGESDIVRQSSIFNALPLETEDIHAAKKALETVYKTRANRRSQTSSDSLVGSIRQHADGRPILFFAGHNDHAAGTQPYDEQARRFHSPIFSSSKHAAAHLEQLAAKNGWFVVYKPHPFAARSQSLEGSDHLEILLEDVDIHACIELADCVITTVSQTSYVSLLRGRPLVMVGYNQLRSSGCCYQVNTEEDISNTIEEALGNGFTNLQNEAWLEHVARILKYYLFQFNGNSTALPEARDVSDLAATIEAAAQRPIEEQQIRWSQ